MPATFQYCLDNKVLGVGWRVDTDRLTETTNWDDYYQEASLIHTDLNICKYIQRWVSKGDLAWTRDNNGNYYLAQVTSGWEYWTSPQGREQDIDIANVFRCNFHAVDVDEVPGKVIACFRAPRTIQEIADEKARIYSQYLWNKRSGKNIYKIDKSGYFDIFMMLDDEETEDLVFLYLQSKGWYVVPNSRKGDTMRYEFLLTHSKTFEKAETQVKTGDAEIDLNDYATIPCKVFLFQSNERYKGKETENVVCIPRDELRKFMIDNIKWFPGAFRRKLEIVTS